MGLLLLFLRTFVIYFYISTHFNQFYAHLWEHSETFVYDCSQLCLTCHSLMIYFVMLTALIEVSQDEELDADEETAMDEEVEEEADLETDVSAYADTHAEDEANASFLDVAAPDDVPTIIYPAYKITRWYKPASGDHFYCKDPNGEIAPRIGYVAEGTPFITVQDTAPGSVPLYRYVSRTNGEHFYTTSNTAENHLHVYTPEGNIGHVFPTQQPQTVPLYRCYNGGNGDHFYTLHNNCENARPAYTPEGITGYVYPADIAFPAAPPVPEERPVFIRAGPQVFRWYQPSSKDTFMCLDPNGELAPKLGYQEGGALFTAVNETAPGAIPLYRFLGNGQHFYSIKKDAEGLPNYSLEGVVGGVYPFRATATVPLHRCHNYAANRYFYTLDAKCEGRPDYHYQVLVGYVFPPQFNAVTVQNERFPVNMTEKIYPNKVHHRCTDLRTHYRQFPTEQRDCTGDLHFEGPHFTDVSSRAPAAVRLFKFKNKLNGNLYYSRSENADGYIASFDADGDIGYVFPTMQRDTIPLYRCYSNEKGAHMVTTHPNCDNLVPQYHFLDAFAWVYNTTVQRPIEADEAVAAEVTIAMDKKVFRWLKPATGAYFLTADPKGEIAAQVGYRFQEALFVTANATNATIPLHRFYGKGMHFYSTDRAAEGHANYTYEGVTGHIYPSRVTATVPLYRCYNEQSQRYLFTLSKICEELPGFVYDVRLGYVYVPKIEITVREGVVGLTSTNNVYPPAVGGRLGSYNPAKNAPVSQLQNLRNLVNNTSGPVNATAAPVANDSGAKLICEKNGIACDAGFFTYPNGTSVALGNNGTVTVVNAEGPNPLHPNGCYNNATYTNGVCLCLPQFTGKWCQLMSPTYRPRQFEAHSLGNLTTLIQSVDTRLSELENAAGKMEVIDRIIETTAEKKVAKLHVKAVRNTFHEALSRNDLFTAKTQLGVMKHLNKRMFVELSRELAIHEDKMNTEFSQMRPVIQKMAVPTMRNFMYDNVDVKKAPFTGLRALRIAEDAIQKADVRRREFNLVYADQV